MKIYSIILSILFFSFCSCNYTAEQLEKENGKSLNNQLQADSIKTIQETKILRTALILTWEKQQQGYNADYLYKFYDSIFAANNIETDKGDVIYYLKYLDSATTIKELDSIKMSNHKP